MKNHTQCILKYNSSSKTSLGVSENNVKQTYNDNLQ